MYFPDDGTITITPVSPPSDVLDGYAISGISIEGIQTQIRIVNPPECIHITSKSSSNTDIDPSQRFIIFDSSVTLKSITFPDADDPKVIPGVEYVVIVSSGEESSNTIQVHSGGYLNNELNGTYKITGLPSEWVRVGVTSDGVRWFAV